MLFNKWGAGNPTNPHFNCHTHTISVRKPSNNDDSWTNYLVRCAFLGRIKGALNRSISTCWASWGSFCPLASLIHSRGSGTNQGGANVRHRVPQAHLCLRPRTPALQHGPWVWPSRLKLGPELGEAMGPGLISLRSAQDPLSKPL